MELQQLAYKLRDCTRLRKVRFVQEIRIPLCCCGLFQISITIAFGIVVFASSFVFLVYSLSDELFLKKISAIVALVFAFLFCIGIVSFNGLILFSSCLEICWSESYTFMRRNEVPKPSSIEMKTDTRITRVKDSLLGRKILLRGYLIAPKLQEYKTLPKSYDLTFSDDAKPDKFFSWLYYLLLTRKTGFLKLMAASSQFEDEKIMQVKKLRVLPILLLCGAIHLMINLSVVAITSLLIFSCFMLYDVKITSYFSVGDFFIIACFVFLFFAVAINIFAGCKCIQALTTFVVITDKRIIHCYLDYMCHKIEYLNYKDIRGFSFDKKRKITRAKITKDLICELRKIRTLTSCCNGRKKLRDTDNPILDYIEAFPKQESLKIFKSIRDLKSEFDKVDDDLEEEEENSDSEEEELELDVIEAEIVHSEDQVDDSLYMMNSQIIKVEESIVRDNYVY